MSNEKTLNTELMGVINRCKLKLELRAMPDDLIAGIFELSNSDIKKDKASMSQFFYGKQELFCDWLTGVYIKGAFNGGSFKDVLQFFSSQVERTEGYAVGTNEVMLVLINNAVEEDQYENISAAIAEFGYSLVSSVINETKATCSVA